MSDRLSGKDKVEIAIEAGLQAIPLIGGSLSTLYFSTKNEKRFKRVESFYQEFSKIVEKADGSINHINSDYESHLMSLIERLNDKIERESRQLKRVYFKKYLFSLLQNQNVSSYDKHLFFLETLDNINELDCEILMFLNENQNNKIQVGSIERPNVPQYAIVGSIGQLKNFGFLATFTGSIIMSGEEIDNSLSDTVRITDYGKEFISFCLV